MTITEILDGVETITPVVVGRIFSTQSEASIVEFIDTYRDGWIGHNGKHARILAQLMFVLHTA
jgi:hypothetical protein